MEKRGAVGVQQRLALLKAAMASNKPRAVYSANPVTGEMFNRESGLPVPGPGHVKLLLDHPDKAAEFNLKFGPGAAEEVLAQYGVKKEVIEQLGLLGRVASQIP